MNTALGECPPATTIASFIDGKLSAERRDVVAGHVADCRDCYEVFAGAVSMEETGPGARPSPVVSSWRAWALGSIAAAALIGATLSLVQMRDPLRPVMTAASALPRRPIEARLDGFPAARWEAVRGPDDATLVPMMRLSRAAARVSQLEGNDARTLHARGVAALLLGHEQDAIRDLAAATKAKPRNARYWSDLAAAHLERGKEDASALAHALHAADRALVLDPDFAEAAFNRALTLEKLGQDRAAIQAYDRYLRLDPTSRFAQDVARSRDRLIRSQDQP